MGDVTSRSVSCCSNGALEDFGVACAGFDWRAAHSPQKIPEVRFLYWLKRSELVLRFLGQASSKAICTLHDFFDLDSAICGSWVMWACRRTEQTSSVATRNLCKGALPRFGAVFTRISGSAVERNGSHRRRCL